MTDKLLTIDELAETLGGLGRASIYRHIKSLPGFPQPVKIGAATRFRQSEVQAYIRCDDLIDEGCPPPIGEPNLKLKEGC